MAITLLPDLIVFRDARLDLIIGQWVGIGLYGEIGLACATEPRPRALCGRFPPVGEDLVGRSGNMSSRAGLGAVLTLSGLPHIDPDTARRCQHDIPNRRTTDLGE